MAPQTSTAAGESSEIIPVSSGCRPENLLRNDLMVDIGSRGVQVCQSWHHCLGAQCWGASVDRMDRNHSTGGCAMRKSTQQYGQPWTMDV